MYKNLQNLFLIEKALSFKNIKSTFEQKSKF